MNIPGFTAEATVGEVKESYALTFRRAAQNGSVLPQSTSCQCFYYTWGVVCRCFPVVE